VGEVGFGAPGGPRFLHKVVPLYPDFARKQEMQGTVLLRVAIDEHGRVVNVEVLKKAGFGFDEAAVKAVRESTFVPAQRDGRSCSCKALLPIRFELKSSDAD
jgi:protein TonB